MFRGIRNAGRIARAVAKDKKARGFVASSSWNDVKRGGTKVRAFSKTPRGRKTMVIGGGLGAMGIMAGNRSSGRSDVQRHSSGGFA